MRYRVMNLGCKVNRVESDGFEAVLGRHGQPAAEPADADIVVVNTCTVTAEAEKKTRKAIRRALRESPKATVYVTGCSVAIDAHRYDEFGTRIQVVPKERMEALLEERSAAGDSSLHPGAVCAPTRVRRGVKVQDGCDNGCSFCIVCVARGRSRSVPADDITDACNALMASGVPEIVLTGINLGAYEWRGMGLPHLLTHLLSVLSLRDQTGAIRCRLRVSSLEPQDVTEDLGRVMAEADGAVCRHLHLPLQSGSDAVLGRMGRRYDAARFMEIVGMLRSFMPRIALTTDVMAGFPGETEEDFEETLRVCQAAAFSRMHVFPYSVREHTRAAAMPHQLPEEIKARRTGRLRSLSAELGERDRRARRATVELAVVERTGVATTESYHEVRVPSDLSLGTLVPFRFDDGHA